MVARDKSVRIVIKTEVNSTSGGEKKKKITQAYVLRTQYRLEFFFSSFFFFKLKKLD